jgi:hypothetical protein
MRTMVFRLSARTFEKAPVREPECLHTMMIRKKLLYKWHLRTKVQMIIITIEKQTIQHLMDLNLQTLFLESLLTVSYNIHAVL